MLLALLACVRATPPQTALPPAVDLRRDDAARLVIVGDTGTSGDGPDTCDAADVAAGVEHVISSRAQEVLAASVAAEGADALVAVGDLAYLLGPRCRGATLDPAARARVGRRLQWIDDVPGKTLLVLGNHDVWFSRRGAAATEACYGALAEVDETVVFPAGNYVVDLGVARIGVLDTNRPPADAPYAELVAALGDGTPWRILAGHHVLRTWGDKEGERQLDPWFAADPFRPDLYVNGHAHFLQFGVYGGVPALTSGAGAKVRCRSECVPGGESACGEGERWGRSVLGYSVVDIVPERIRVTFKDHAGTPLWCWERGRADPEGHACEG